MALSRPVNSVVRAVALLKAMNARAVSTIDELHRETKIPKPTIVRLLQTLKTQDLVRHSPRHGAYCLTSEVEKLSCGYHGVPQLIEASASRVDDMTREIKWPMAIAIPDSAAVSICYSTIPLSPFSLHHSSIGMRLSLVSRALGRAYLAFCDDNERDALIKMIRKSSNREDAVAKNEGAMRTLIAEVRRRGVATRDPNVRAVSNTLAVPIRESGRVVASVGLTFISAAMTQDEALDRYRSALLDLSQDISRELSELGRQKGPAGPATSADRHF